MKRNSQDALQIAEQRELRRYLKQAVVEGEVSGWCNKKNTEPMMPCEEQNNSEQDACAPAVGSMKGFESRYSCLAMTLRMAKQT